MLKWIVFELWNCRIIPPFFPTFFRFSKASCMILIIRNVIKKMIAAD